MCSMEMLKHIQSIFAANMPISCNSSKISTITSTEETKAVTGPLSRFDDSRIRHHLRQALPTVEVLGHDATARKRTISFFYLCLVVDGFVKSHVLRDNCSCR